MRKMRLIAFLFLNFSEPRRFARPLGHLVSRNEGSFVSLHREGWRQRIVIALLFRQAWSGIHCHWNSEGRYTSACTSSKLLIAYFYNPQYQYVTGLKRNSWKWPNKKTNRNVREMTKRMEDVNALREYPNTSVYIRTCSYFIQADKTVWSNHLTRSTSFHNRPPNIV